MTSPNQLNRIINRSPYLKNAREFPEEVEQLAFQVNLTYVEIANAVNQRVIGIFPTTNPAVTGEAYYITTNKQQSFRQVYTFTTTANIPHNIDFVNIYGFSLQFGSYTDGTNWYGLIPGTSVAIPGVISFYLTPTDIVFNVGAGAPALTKGLIVLTWLAPQ